MGSSVSAILAILFMDNLESATIRSDLSISIYKRYVDDIYNEEQDDTFHLTMNQAHPRIKFEIEKPTRNPGGPSLSLLDFTVAITDQGPSTFEFYKKKAQKPLFVHYKSALPSTTKKNIISNECKRIEQRCSDPHIRTKHNNSFGNVLRLNIYPQTWIDHAHQPSTTTEPQAEPNQQWFYLKIPYVSDVLDFRIKTIFRKEGIPIRVAHQSYSLRQALSTQTTERGCTRKLPHAKQRSLLQEEHNL
ncbi:hypothetical protein QZH41_000654 [Actinostola sp. cb2023]|nr:hypothetical protein QZH41_000654 [Actinostola sp. cb2023]